MDNSGTDPGLQPRPETWREETRPERRKRHRHRGDNRSTLRSVTVTAAVAAAGLNALLFAQIGIEQSGTGSVQDAIVSAFNGLFPRGGLQAPANVPTAAPGTTPVATTGGS